MAHDQPAPQQSAQSEPSMSLEEARQIKWMYPPHPTLGELWDRGELTSDNLKYALGRGHRQLRRAARVLLDELDGRQPALPTAVQKPTRGTSPTSPTRPALHGSRSAAAPKEDRPREASPPRYGPRVVIASDYLADQETLHGWLLAYYVGLGVGALFLTINTLLWLLRGQALWITTLSIVANVGAWVWAIVVVRRQIRHVRSFRVGRKGEDEVVEQLRQALDHHWTIYRNLQLPDRKSDLDLVLVGPGGVWAVQVKATAAPLRVQAGRWEMRRGGRWVAAQPDPAKQVIGQALALNDFFKRQGINRFVEKAIALADPQPFDQFTTSEIPIWLPFNTTERAAALATRFPPTDDEIARIDELLSRRAGEQRAVEAERRRRKL